MTISEIKKIARTKLQGSYFRCVISSLLYFVIVLVLSYLGQGVILVINNDIVTMCISIVFAIISSLLGYGIIANILDLTDIKTNSVTDFINIAIKNTTNYIKILFLIFVRIVIPLLLFLFSFTYLLAYMALSVNYYNSLFKGVNGIILISFIITFFILVYFLLKYILVSYIYHENSHLSSKEIVEKSKIIMRGKKLNFLLLILSFIHWFLITGIILYFLGLFIPAKYLSFFTVILFCLLKPYMVVCISTFYEENNQ